MKLMLLTSRACTLFMKDSTRWIEIKIYIYWSSDDHVCQPSIKNSCVNYLPLQVGLSCPQPLMLSITTKNTWEVMTYVVQTTIKVSISFDWNTVVTYTVRELLILPATILCTLCNLYILYHYLPCFFDSMDPMYECEYSTCIVLTLHNSISMSGYALL